MLVLVVAMDINSEGQTAGTTTSYNGKLFLLAIILAYSLIFFRLKSITVVDMAP
jgi:hypothetical protein